MSYAQINAMIGHCSPLMLRDIVMTSPLSHKERSVLIERLVDDYLQSLKHLNREDSILLDNN